MPSPIRRSKLVAGLATLALLTSAIVSSPVSASSVAPKSASGPRTISHTVIPRLLHGKAHRLGTLSRAQTIPLAVALQPPHLAQEQAFVASLQDRASPNFHHYLTPKQWDTRFAPTRSAEQAVVSWLGTHGFQVTKRYPNRLLIDAVAQTGTVETAFKVSLSRYHMSGQAFYANSHNPTVPTAIARYVQNVVGLNDFGVGMSNALTPHLKVRPGFHTQRANVGTSSTNGNPAILRTFRMRHISRSARLRLLRGQLHIRPHITNGFIDPTNLWSSYGYSVGALSAQGHCCNPFHVSGPGDGGSPKETSIAIATACPYATSDIAAFVAQYGLAENLTSVSVDGGPAANSNCANATASGGGGFETTLDTEYSMAMSNSFGSYLDTAHVYVYEAPASGVSKSGGPTMASQTFFDLWNQIITDDRALNVSMSWGGAEDNWTAADMDTGHNTLTNLVGIGASVTIASGDNGAYEDTNNPNTLYPQYPGSDPWVTSAGGTQLSLNDDGSYNSEQAWNSGGGGCSGHFSASDIGAATYQTANSFNNGCAYNNGGNTSYHRSQPDISMNASCGSQQAIYAFGGWGGVCGTSEVAPELAGLFAQFNAYALTEGNNCGNLGGLSCAPIGVVNYYIWQQGVDGNNYAPHLPFYDITTGNNDNGTGTGTYAAGTGYDLATGWGVPNALQFYRLIAYYNTPDFQAPTVTFSGPGSGWFDYNAEIDWTVSDPTQGDYASSGVDGFSQAWDQDPGDPTAPATQGAGNPYYDGPEFPNATSGFLRLGDLNQQGCHYVNVRAWDNIGWSSGDQTYGPVCYDTIPPSINSITFSPKSPSNAGTVTISASATDPGGRTHGSGVSTISYYANSAIDGSNSGNWTDLGTTNGASGSVNWSTGAYADGLHLIAAVPTDRAGNTLYCDPPSHTNDCATFRVDHTAPSTVLLLNHKAPLTSAYTYPLLVSLSGADGAKGSGVKHRYYSLDGSAFKVYSSAFEIKSARPSPHVIRYYSIDNAGNKGATKTRNVTVVKPPDWPLYRFSATHSGINPSETILTRSNVGTLTRSWYTPSIAGLVTAPTVANGVVYTGSSSTHRVYAMDSLLGTTEWSFLTGGAVTASPAATPTAIYVGSHDGYLYSLNPANGQKIWSFKTAGAITASPTISGSAVYVGSADHKVYAINAANGHLLWSFVTAGAVQSSAAVANSLVYVGSDDGKVYALKTASGAKAWSFKTGGAVHSSPAVLGKSVYVGSSDRYVYALNGSTGAKQWGFKTLGPVVSSPAVNATTVFAGSTDHHLYALKVSDGTKLWSYAGTGAVSDPAMANGIVYFTSASDSLYALNSATGAKDLRLAFGGSAAPVVDNGHVFLGNGHVYSFGLH